MTICDMLGLRGISSKDGIDLLSEIFTICVLALVYVYAGYPLLARMLDGLARHRVWSAAPGEHLP